MKSRETSQPKATNIIRPTKRGPSSVHSNSSERKIKVPPTNILEKPGFNIYTPKSTHRTGKAFTLPVTTSENNRPRLMSRTSGRSVSGSLSAEVYQRPVESYHKSNSTPTGNYSKHLTHSPMEARQGFNIIPPENRPEEKVYSIKTKEESEEDTEEESEEEEEEEDSEEDDDPVMNEARTNRKIEDLELSLKSLLAVNNMLEATVKKQAQQILQLKKNSNGTQQVEPVHETKEKETEEEEEENDELFERIQKVTKEMIEQGKNCVEFEYKITGRVLTNYALKEEEEEEE